MKNLPAILLAFSPLSLAFAAAPAPPNSVMPEEVVIKGTSSSEAPLRKPPLRLVAEPPRAAEQPNLSLEEDALILFESGGQAALRAVPASLHTPRILNPGKSLPGESESIRFSPLSALAGALRKEPPPKEAARYRWSLAVLDESGKAFHVFEGESDPPAEISWNGKNKKGEWLRSGAVYSPIYQFTGPDGGKATFSDRPVTRPILIREDKDGLRIGVDPAAGPDTLRAVVETIKRHKTSRRLVVDIGAASEAAAQALALRLRESLAEELSLGPRDMEVSARAVPVGQRRVEVFLPVR